MRIGVFLFFLFVCLGFYLINRSNFSVLDTYEDLQKIMFGKDFPRQGLLLLCWLLSQGKMDQNGKLQLNFDPTDETNPFGFHQYKNFDHLFPDLPNAEFQYYTLGNLYHGNTRELPKYIIKNMCKKCHPDRNIERVVIRIQTRNPRAVDEVYITQHFVNNGRSNDYDKQLTFLIGKQLLKSIIMLCRGESKLSIKDLDKEDPDYERFQRIKNMFPKNEHLQYFLYQSGYKAETQRTSCECKGRSKSDKKQNAFSLIMCPIVNVFSLVCLIFSSLFSLVSMAVSSLFSLVFWAVSSLFSLVFWAVSSLFSLVFWAVSKLFSLVYAGFGNLFSLVYASFGNLFSLFYVPALLEAVKVAYSYCTLSNLFSLVFWAFSSLFSLVCASFSSLFSLVYASFGSLFSLVYASFGSLFSLVYASFSNLFSLVYASFSNLFSLVYASFSSLFSLFCVPALLEAVKVAYSYCTFSGLFSLVFWAFSGFFSLGYLTFNSLFSLVYAGFGSLFSLVYASFGSLFSLVYASFGSLFSLVYASFGSLFSLVYASFGRLFSIFYVPALLEAVKVAYSYCTFSGLFSLVYLTFSGFFSLGYLTVSSLFSLVYLTVSSLFSLVFFIFSHIFSLVYFSFGQLLSLVNFTFSFLLLFVISPKNIFGFLKVSVLNVCLFFILALLFMVIVEYIKNRQSARSPSQRVLRDEFLK